MKVRHTTTSCNVVVVSAADAAGHNRRRCRLLTAAQLSNNIPPVTAKTTSLQLSNSKMMPMPSSSSSSCYSAVSVPVSPATIKATPELGLVSLLFVLSTVFSAFISLAVISLPTMNAFRRLEASANQLSNMVSQEVRGTLFSLKLSSLEIQELTQQLARLREKISASPSPQRKSRSTTTQKPKTSF